MTADEVRGDPVQPGAGVRPADVVPVPLPERHEERLGGEVVGGVTAEPAFHVPVHVGEVRVEDRREPLRLVPRGTDDVGV
jgi:hypothetical protein